MKRILLLAALLTGIGCGVAHAQIWKKIEKAAEKVNNALESVNNTLDNVEGALNSTGLFGMFPKPKLTQYTVRFEVPSDTEVVGVAEGIVTLQSNYKLGFYSLKERRMITDFEWEKVGGYSDVPLFSGGVIAVKKGSAYYILYPDGRTREVAEAKELYPFHGGIAGGKKKKGDWSSEPAFFDRNGRQIWTELTSGLSSYTEVGVRELHEGLRAVQAGNWGFVNASGKVVIPLEYAYVSDFSEGIALVSKSQGQYSVIDKSGKVLVDNAIKGGYTVPRPFHDGWAFLPYYNSFTDRNGRQKEDLTDPRDFHEGWTITKINYSDICLVDKSFTKQIPLKAPDDGHLSFVKVQPTHMVDGCALLETYDNTYLFDYTGAVRLGTDTKQCWMTGLYDGGYIVVSLDKENNSSYNRAAFGICHFDGRIRVVFDRKAQYREIGGPDKVKEDPDPYPDPEPEVFLDLSRQSIVSTSAGIEASFTVSSNVAWTLSADVDWLAITPVQGKSGETEVNVTVPKYDGEKERTGTVTVTGGGLTETLLVRQHGAAGGEEEEGDEKDDNKRRKKGGDKDDKVVEIIIGEVTIEVTPEDWGPDDEGNPPDDDTIEKIVQIYEKPGTDSLFIIPEPQDDIDFRTPEEADQVGPGIYRIPKKPKGPIKLKVVPADHPEVTKKWALGGRQDFSKVPDSHVANMFADVRIVTDPAGISGTPFGKDTKGLFIVDFNQKDKITAFWNGDESKPIKDFATYFWGPFRILGFDEDELGKYILMTGGITAVGNWLNYDKDNELLALMITLMVSMSDSNNENTDGDPTYLLLSYPHKYRIRYTDLSDGGMKLGLLERYSDVYGWVPSNDKRLIVKKRKNMGFATMTNQKEQPIETNALDGLELHWIQRPAGLPSFYPGRNWFMDEEQYQHMVGVFDKMYNSQGSDSINPEWSTPETRRAFIKSYISRWKLRLIK